MRTILFSLCILVCFHTLRAQITSTLREKAREDSETKNTRRKEDRERLVSIAGGDGSRQPSGPTRNNQCRDPALCQAIADESMRQLDEKAFLESQIAGNTDAVNELNSGSIKATGCFLTAVDCSRINDNFRTANGTCNNKNDAYLGSIFTPFDRILAPEYSTGDGVRSGLNPRTISRKYHLHDANSRSLGLTLLAMQFGQFLDHDITHTPTTTVFNANNEAVDVNCCNDEQASLSTDCAKISIEAPDEAFGQISCMHFMRSAPITNVLSGSCQFGSRQQMNQITSFVDASNVYGSTDAKMEELRLDNGLLKVTELSQSAPNAYLPQDSAHQCGDNACFLAGDDRANEQVDLTVLHTIFMREHNKIANKVRAAKRNWNGDRVFRETRKIMAAIMQNIVYGEYLPAILGINYVEGSPQLSLFQSQSYDPTVRPTILNEFATAAFRFGHSQLPDQLPREGKAPIDLSTVFFNPYVLYEAGNPVQEMTTAIVKDESMVTDRFFTPQVTENLFRTSTAAFDLVALNIQRGRDHGLPSYKTYKQYYGDSAAADIDPNTYDALLDAYGGQEDAIDLFVGGISERNEDGAAVGKLFQRIIADQFIRLRVGDRFFFDNGNHYSSEAVNEIKKVRLSHILCRNADLVSVKEFAFLKHSQNEIACDTVQSGVDVNKIFGTSSGTGGTGDGSRKRRPGRR